MDDPTCRIFRAAVDEERTRRGRPRNREAQVRARAFAECYAEASGHRVGDAEREIAAAADALTEEW